MDLQNCLSSIKCEPKTRRLAKTNYIRPTQTITDTLQTKAKMEEKLENYKRVDTIDDISLNTHVRYVTLKNGKQRFCLGGLLKKIHSKYVILSNGNFTWSVQRYHWEKTEDEEPAFETVFFSIMSKEAQLQKQIEMQKRQINKLTSHIKENSR